MRFNNRVFSLSDGVGVQRLFKMVTLISTNIGSITLVIARSQQLYVCFMDFARSPSFASSNVYFFLDTYQPCVSHKLVKKLIFKLNL